MRFFALSLCFVLFIQYYNQGDAAVTQLQSVSSTSTSISVSWVINPADTTTAVTITVDSGSAISVNTSSYTATGLSNCSSHTFTVSQALSPVSSATITAYTTPPLVTSVTAVQNSDAVTISWTASSTAPSTPCPYWIQVNLVETTSGVTYTSIVSGTSNVATIYDVNAGTYSVRVNSVTSNSAGLSSSSPTLIVAAYVTTTTTTTATTTASGGQYVAILTAKLYNTDGSAAVYRSQHSVVGSPAYAAASTAICTSIQNVISGNTSLLSAFERCYAISFTNGSLIGQIAIVFTASKLSTSTGATIQSVITSLFTTQTQAGSLIFNTTQSAILYNVTKNTAATWHKPMFNLLIISGAVNFLTGYVMRAVLH